MKRKFLLVFCFLSSMALADDAGFGRVFTTPAERAELDRKREQIVSGKNPVSQSTNQEVVTTTSAKTNKEVELSGYIVREDGSATVWINGRSALSGLNEKEFKASTRDNQGKVFVSTDGKFRSLKPGQVWLLEKNSVQESWQNRTAEQESSVHDE